MTNRAHSGAAKTNLFRLLKLSIALGLVLVAMPSSASAQATRTWVSGVGDDVNPCSRTAPCKTFSGAISKTANGGEINCLDPGGFGGVTITKSLTIDCSYTEGGVLVSGTNAIVVNAAATDKVILRGLDINGIGTGAATSLVGVKVLGAKSVKIYDTSIYRFKAGVAVVPTTANTRVLIKNSEIENNEIGVIAAPGSAAGAGVRTTVRGSSIASNANCGLVASSDGANASTPVGATNCGAGSTGNNLGSALLNAFDNEIIDHDEVAGATGSTGVFAKGTAGVIRIGGNLITGNTHGLRTEVSGFGGIFSFGDNYIFANGTNGTPTGTVTPTRR